MKKLLILPLILFSCKKEQEINDLMIIKIEQLMITNDSLQNELENCNNNYQAISEVLNKN